jgi:nitrogen fixation protein FixH
VNTGRWWPLAIGFVLVLTVLANVAVYWTANHDPSFAVEPDYYRRAVEWDSTVAHERRSAALGWRVDARLSPPEGGQATLHVQLRSRDGAPLDSADVRAEASHNARGAELFEVRLVEDGAGEYAGSIPSTRQGLWRVELSAVHGTDDFTERVTLDNGSPATP